MIHLKVLSYIMNKVVAIIPARQNSLRIKNKNLKNLDGKPLIWWTFNEAKKSKYIDEIYVTSDSKKILNLSKKNKVQTIKRPKNISDNHSTKKDVIFHAIDFLKKKGKYFNYLIYLQPTSPLRGYKQIDMSLKQVFARKAAGLVSVNKIDGYYWKLDVINKKISNDIKKDIFFTKRSQDLKPAYKPNGAIYIFNLDKLKYKNEFDISKGFEIFIMDRISSIDIDNIDDFKLAELIKKNNNEL